MTFRGKLSRRRLRVLLAFLVAIFVATWAIWYSIEQERLARQPLQPATPQSSELAASALANLPIKGRAPKTGYSRQQFGGDWATVNGCDMRERILIRDLTNITYRNDDGCTVLSGILQDPYTGKEIHFTRGAATSEAVQIDHVVAIGDAWQKGAQQLAKPERVQLYNDPLELLAVDGPANQQKSDGDAATWLPPNKSYRCRYVARQIAVKQKYRLWVTQAEHDAMQRILDTCPVQALPIVGQ